MLDRPFTRTTVDLPAGLLAAADRIIAEGKAKSRNELVADGLRSQIERIEQAGYDAQFRAMADDPEYQAEAHQLLAEFEVSDRETWKRIRDESRDSG
jgi:metal-responsive CopG/Arc/MetJ family transcriptional regulator